MRPPGIIEIILILVIVFIIFGAGKLPQILEFFGKGVRSLRGGGGKSEENEEQVKTVKRSRKKSARG
jgi:sec-independent protein translocase protein TatA